MVVTVSLDPEEGWRRQAVPRVHLVDGLVDALAVFFPQEAVVLDIVDQLQVENTPECIQELVFQALPAEEPIDR